MCGCVCVCEREIWKCVCVCVCEREIKMWKCGDGEFGLLIMMSTWLSHAPKGERERGRVYVWARVCVCAMHSGGNDTTVDP